MLRSHETSHPFLALRITRQFALSILNVIDQMPIECRPTGLLNMHKHHDVTCIANVEPVLRPTAGAHYTHQPCDPHVL